MSRVSTLHLGCGSVEPFYFYLAYRASVFVVRMCARVRVYVLVCVWTHIRLQSKETGELTNYITESSQDVHMVDIKRALVKGIHVCVCVCVCESGRAHV